MSAAGARRRARGLLGAPVGRCSGATRASLSLLLLLPPVLWLGIVYLGSLFALLVQSFFSIDEFSGLIVHEFTLKTYARAAAARPISTSSCAPC